MIKIALILGIIIGIVSVLIEQKKQKESAQNKESKRIIKDLENSTLLNPPKKQELIHKYDITTFHIAGVTFKDGRESRQTSLRMLKFKDAPMDGDILFEFEQYEYEGKPAIKILANNRILGNVPANIVDEFIYKMANANDYDIEYEVLGGGEFSYGCVMTFTWR